MATTQTSEDYIGIDNLYYAEVVADTTSGLTYGTPAPLAPVGSLQKTTSSDTQKSYYDNAVYKTVVSEDSDELTFTTPALDLETLAKLTGKTIDSTSKALVDNGEPITKYFAILYRTQLSDNSYRFVVHHKVSFAVPDEKVDGKKDSVTLNGQELKGTSIRTINKFSIGGGQSGVKRIVADERDGKVDVSKWFTTVPVPGAIPLVTP